MIAEVLSLPENLVIDANSEVDVSALSYFITVIESYHSEIGQEINYDGDEEKEVLNSIREVTISVNAYGLNSYEIISKLTASMNLTPVWQALKDLGIGFLRSSQVRNLPTTIAAGKENRAQVDLIFSINHIIQADVRRGDYVQIKTEIN
ncbi:MAG: hypothetical protein [Caudoviricetes sp.]|nr:MAG: hypothetical protein [Caudoviricetes sp.]